MMGLRGVRLSIAMPEIVEMQVRAIFEAAADCTKRGIVGAGVDAATIDWIIVGGESGPNARPMHPDWARSIRDQCQAAGVPFFFKQWGEHVTGYLDGEDFYVDEEAHGPSVNWNGTARCHDIPGESGHYGRVGKRAAGRLLDGREHNEMPERANG